MKPYTDPDNVPAGASRAAVTAYRLSRILTAQMEAVVMRQGGLSLVEWRICVGLAQSQAITQKELVDYSKMEQGQVSRSLARLEARGLISSARCEEDGRARRYSLTDLGHARFESILPAATDFSGEIDGAVSTNDLKSFMEIAERFAAAAQQSNVDDDRRAPEAA